MKGNSQTSTSRENLTLTCSTEALKQLLFKTKGEFCQTATYQKVSTQLQQKLGISKEDCTLLLQMVGQEAIRLTIHNLLQSGMIGQQPPTVQPQLTPEAAPASLPPEPTVRPRPTAKKTKKQLRLEAVLQEWQDCVGQVGAEIKRLRTLKGFSLEKLHTLSLVPIYHLRSLEAGRVEQLPEPIYVRGFVRRIAEALGIPSSQLLAILPTQNPDRDIVPTWSRQASGRHGGMHPLMLYVGYTTLMAGAIGGLNWVNQQPSLERAVEAQPLQPASVSSLATDSPSIATPHLSAVSVAAPENLLIMQ